MSISPLEMHFSCSESLSHIWKYISSFQNSFLISRTSFLLSCNKFLSSRISFCHLAKLFSRFRSFFSSPERDLAKANSYFHFSIPRLKSGAIHIHANTFQSRSDLPALDELPNSHILFILFQLPMAKANFHY